MMTATQFDSEMTLTGNNIRFGKLNDRVYITDATIELPNTFHKEVEDFAMQGGFSKIIAKVKDAQVLPFLKRGYQIEATVPGYFGLQDAIFISRFFDEERAQCDHMDLSDDILNEVQNVDTWQPSSFSQPVFFRKCNQADVRALSKLYQLAFSSYGSPIGDEHYISHSIKNGVDYFCVEYMDAIVACVRIEYEKDAPNARLYDTVVLSQFRNEGIASALIHEASKYLKNNGVEFIYSVCRASSFAINKVFARLDFEYGGRLINNNLVNNKLVSMNVWSQKL
jgi:putative beta-lysine N-acetyltransferase